MRVSFFIFILSNSILKSGESLGFLFQRQQKLITPLIKYRIQTNISDFYHEQTTNNTFSRDMFMILDSFLL